MLAGITDIYVITTPQDSEAYQRALGHGEMFGISISYIVQEKPNGIAEAFILTEEFVGNNSVCLILGDNIFWGRDLSHNIDRAIKNLKSGFSTIFAYQVSDPHRYGVVEVNGNRQAISLEEKPQEPKSNYAITGLYFYNSSVFEKAKKIKPSLRGELEITDLNNIFLDENSLLVEILGRGFSWIDTGTHESLLEAGNFIKSIESHQGYKIACLEEIALVKGWLHAAELLENITEMPNTGYYAYIRQLISNAN